MSDANYDNLKVNQKLQLGDKWSLFGNGDPRANDEWLRLLNKDGSDYSGGLATQKLWTKSLCVQEGDIVVSRTGGPTSNMATFVAQKLDPPSINWQHDKSGTNPVCYGYVQVGNFANTKEFRFVAENSSNFTFLNGKVGIGKSDPYVTLEVRTAADKSIDGINVVAPCGASALLRPHMGQGFNSGIVQEGDAGIIFSHQAKETGAFVIAPWTDSNSGIRIDASGKVGIGVSSPQERLHVDGSIRVTKDVILDGGADCAEDFDVLVAEVIEPGSVMVIDQDGQLRISTEAYDKKVAGVVSGAGEFKPGMILDRQSEQKNRIPISLMGKVYCKVDAQNAPIEVGDLLTSSSTPGHAMKATDPLRAFGAVIGKALKSLDTGTGLIPIIVALQ